MTILSIIATVLSLLGNLLLAKKNVTVFPIWILANAMWIIIIATTSANIPQIIMYFVYIFTSLYSWVEWNKSDTKEAA